MPQSTVLYGTERESCRQCRYVVSAYLGNRLYAGYQKCVISASLKFSLNFTNGSIYHVILEVIVELGGDGVNVKSAQPVSAYFKAMQQCKDARETKDQSRLEAIRNILLLGKKLRTDEMDYLQRQDPNLHDQALRLSMERQAHEDALWYSRSKADANHYNTFKLMTIAGQLKHGGSEELLMRTNAIQEAHREFVRSSKYASLRSER